MEMSLLDYLVRRTCLSYISDLRFHPLECALALRSLDDPGAFSLEDWNRSGSYLSSLYSPPQKDCRSARAALAAALEEERGASNPARSFGK